MESNSATPIVIQATSLPIETKPAVTITRLPTRPDRTTEQLWSHCDKIVGFITPFDYLCRTIQARETDPEIDSKQKLSYLIDETTSVLNHLKKLICICCEVVTEGVDVDNDNDVVELTEELSLALLGLSSDCAKLILKTDIESYINTYVTRKRKKTTIITLEDVRRSRQTKTSARAVEETDRVVESNDSGDKDVKLVFGATDDQGEEENMKDDSDSDDVAPRSRGVRRSSTWTKPYPRPATRRPPFICPLCELPFRSMRRYNHHHQKRRDTEAKYGCKGFPVPKKPQNVRKNGRYYCGHPNCLDPSNGDVKADAENWRSMTQVWRHFELCHASPSDLVFKCKQCNEGFTHRAFLSTHIKEKHEHQFACKFCGQTFGHRTGVLRHEERHTGQKAHKCEECNYRAVTRYLIKRHKMSVHRSKEDMIKSHVCDICGKAFLTPDKLKAHIATHSDERNFLCQHCGKYLKTDNSYRRHLVCVHGIKFTCDCCGKDFSAILGLKVHRRDVHHIVDDETQIYRGADSGAVPETSATEPVQIKSEPDVPDQDTTQQYFSHPESRGNESYSTYT